VERAHKESKTESAPIASELVRGETDGKIGFGLAPNKLKASASGVPPLRSLYVDAWVVGSTLALKPCWVHGLGGMCRADAAKGSVAVPNIFTNEEERNGGQGKASSSGGKGAPKGGCVRLSLRSTQL